MKIAFLIYDINICGGTHKQFLKLLDYSSKQGIEFTVVTKKLDLSKTYVGFNQYKDIIQVYDETDYPKILNHRFVWRFISYFQRKNLQKMLEGYDIVNIHDNGWAREIPYMSNKKIYWQVNDLPGCFNVGVNSKADDNEIKKRERARYLRWAKHVTEFSVNVGKNAERIKNCFGRDAHVFYCGVEPVSIQRNIHETFMRFENKKLNLLTSGVFLFYRNYETQVKTVKMLVEKGIDVHLSIIGRLLNTDYAEKIKQLIKSEGLESRITIEGQVDDQRFKTLHQNADVFLFVNVDQSWGLAVFEAMSCGLPVLVSKSVGAVEILDNNKNAIFVDPMDAGFIANKIEELMNNRDYYKRISEAASVFHEDWTWDKAYCSKMIELMQEQ